MKCKKCGKELTQEDNFCPVCGEKNDIKTENSKLNPTQTPVAVGETSPVVKEEAKPPVVKEAAKPPIVVNTQKQEEQKKEAPKTNKAQPTTKSVNNNEDSGFSVASLVLGIVSLILLIKPGILSSICAILAIVFGLIGRKKGAKTMGTVGMVMGIVSIVSLVLIVVLVFSAIIGMAGLIGFLEAMSL